MPAALGLAIYNTFTVLLHTLYNSFRGIWYHVHVAPRSARRRRACAARGTEEPGKAQGGLEEEE